MALQETMKALSNPVRREILMMLKTGAKPAGDIAQHFELSQATISAHLSLLKHANLIREQKYKNYIYYELNLSVFEEATLWLKGFTNEK